VIEGSRADVSFLAGLLVDKFAYHLPLYRQHQCLIDSGIQVSRPWLTQLTQQTIGLFEPIYDAQFASICASRVKAMDETPIKAGRKERGKMRLAYFWPVYGEHDEVCFPYFPSREAQNVRAALGAEHAPGSVLLTDGYAAYASYAKKVGITHALCWSHSRREFFEAQAADPEGAHEALKRISALYTIEEDIRTLKLTGDAKRLHRLTHSKPHVEAFFAWVDRRLEEHGLRPATPFTHALNYVRDRYQPFGTRATRGSDGKKELELLLDRARCEASRDRAKPDRDLPPARYRRLHVPRRRPATRRPASRRVRRRTYPTTVEAALRLQPAALSFAYPRRVGCTPRSYRLRCLHNCVARDGLGWAPLTALHGREC
jgi:Transposase IS66 family